MLVYFVHLAILLLSYYYFHHRLISKQFEKFAPEECLFHIQDLTSEKPNWRNSWDRILRLKNDTKKISILNSIDLSNLEPPILKGGYAGIFKGAVLLNQPNVSVVLKVSLTRNWTRKSSTSLNGIDFIEESARSLIGVNQILVPCFLSFTLDEQKVTRTLSKDYYHIAIYQKANGGDLEDAWMSFSHSSCYTLSFIINLFKEISKLIAGLHSVGIIHCDVRLSNFLVMSEYKEFYDLCDNDIQSLNIRLHDLSLSRYPQLKNYEWIYPIGSNNVREYAPEGRYSNKKCFENQMDPCFYRWPGITYAIDIYSLGVILEKFLSSLNMKYSNNDDRYFDQLISLSLKMQAIDINNRPKIENVIQFLDEFMINE